MPQGADSRHREGSLDADVEAMLTTKEVVGALAEGFRGLKP